MNNEKIPAWWSEQFRELTGLDPSHEDYNRDTTMFRPRNKYEEDPASALLVITALIAVIAWGVASVFIA